MGLIFILIGLYFGSYLHNIDLSHNAALNRNYHRKNETGCSMFLLDCNKEFTYPEMYRSGMRNVGISYVILIFGSIIFGYGLCKK